MFLGVSSEGRNEIVMTKSMTVFPHLIDGLHREVERHELYDRSETGEGGSHSDPSEPHFRDRSVLDSLVSIFLP